MRIILIITYDISMLRHYSPLSPNRHSAALNLHIYEDVAGEVGEWLYYDIQFGRPL